MNRNSAVWLPVILLLLLAGVAGAVYWKMSQPEKKVVDDSAQKQLEKEGIDALASARQEVDKRDPLWKLSDLPKRQPKLTPEQDATPLLQKAFEEWTRVTRELQKNRERAITFEYAIAALYDTPGGPKPVNQQMNPDFATALQESVRIFAPSRELGVKASKLTKGNFDIVSEQVATESAKNRRASAAKFFGFQWLPQRQEKPIADNTIVSPLCDQAIVDLLAKKPEAWKHLEMALQVAGLPNYIGLESMRLISQGTASALLAFEWFLGQQVFADAQLEQFQKQLTPLLRNATPLKNAVLLHRAMANFFADAYRDDMPHIKVDFHPTLPPPPYLINKGAATFLKLTTEALEKLDRPLGEFNSWFSSEVKKYPQDSRYDGPDELATMSPERFFRIYYLHEFEGVVENYYLYQERIRVALVALAAERYRLRAGKFPESTEDLRSVLGDDVYNDVFSPTSPIKVRMLPTSFGILVTGMEDRFLPNNKDDWPIQVSMRQTRSRLSKYLGFHLYRPELRGQAPK